MPDHAPIAAASRWRTFRRWAGHAGVALLLGELAFLAMELLAVLVVATEDLRGDPARVVLAIALASGCLVAWWGARRFAPALLQLPGDARSVALLVMWLPVGILGEIIATFVCDPEYLMHPPSE